MIGTCEANQMRSARMITGKPHRLHHSFRTRHVERDFVETGNLAEPANIVRNHRMVGAEHGPNACARFSASAMQSL